MQGISWGPKNCAPLFGFRFLESFWFQVSRYLDRNCFSEIKKYLCALIYVRRQTQAVKLLILAHAGPQFKLAY